MGEDGKRRPERLRAKQRGVATKKTIDETHRVAIEIFQLARKLLVCGSNFSQPHERLDYLYVDLDRTLAL